MKIIFSYSILSFSYCSIECNCPGMISASVPALTWYCVKSTVIMPCPFLYISQEAERENAALHVRRCCCSGQSPVNRVGNLLSGMPCISGKSYCSFFALSSRQSIREIFSGCDVLCPKRGYMLSRTSRFKVYEGKRTIGHVGGRVEPVLSGKAQDGFKVTACIFQKVLAFPYFPLPIHGFPPIRQAIFYGMA